MSTDGIGRGFSMRLSNGHTLVLGESTKISAEQLLDLDSDTPECAFAEVAPNPASPDMLGLKNLGAVAWSVLTPAGEQHQIQSGRSIRLAPSTRINFGAITGTIRPAGNGVELEIANQRVPLRAGLKITARGLMGLRGSAPGISVIEVVRNPNDPEVLGLKNLSGSAWSASMPDGRHLQIEPGKSLRLASGARVDFGGFSGSIEQSGAGKVLRPTFGFKHGTRSLAIGAVVVVVVGAGWYALRREQPRRSEVPPTAAAIGADVSPNLSSKPVNPAVAGRATVILAGKPPLTVKAKNGNSDRTEDIARSVFEQNKSALVDTYRRALSAQPWLNGLVAVGATVAADGTVTFVWLDSSDTAEPAFPSLILDTVKSWRFPASSGADVEVVYPLLFARDETELAEFSQGDGQ